MKMKKLVSAAFVAGLSIWGTVSQAQAENDPWTYWLGAGAFFLEGSEPNEGGSLFEGRLGYDLDPNLTLEGGLGGSPFLEGRDYNAPHGREGTYNGRNSPGENWFVKTNVNLLYHMVGSDEDRTLDPYVSLNAGSNYYGKWREGSNWSPFAGPGMGLSYWFNKDAAVRGDYALLFANDGKFQPNHSALLMAFYRFGADADTSGDRASRENGASDLGAKSSGPLKTVYFNYDKADVRKDQQSTLKANAEWLKSNPGKKVSLEGHCDERGTNEYNLALGARRAKSTYDYLRTLGIPKDQMTTQTFGEETPADPGHNEAAWSKNRRVESVLK